MALVVFLCLFASVQLFDSVLSCPPSSCSWTTCSHQWRNDWNPSNPPQGRCAEQSRRAHHINTQHNGKGSCPASRGCSNAAQNRRMCSCRDAYSCPLHEWSQWSGAIPQASCKQQARYRDYRESVRYLIRQNSCSGIRNSCGNRLYDYRKYCSCRFAFCTLQTWSSWTNLPSPVHNDHCASQQRRRQYTLQWRYVDRRDNCNGIGPPGCPAAQDETRERVITCPPLSAPTHGTWDRDDCVSNPQVCKSGCKLQCDTRNGFQVSGPTLRECQSNGQWSTPWNSYCKDVEQPSITCPSSIVVGNDQGKTTARVTLPIPLATDNSGKPPTITNNAGASVKEYQIKKTAHIVTYTATDAAGNKATCYLHITVKDTERPTAVTCPDDIQKEINENNIRVTWKYPTFMDNNDKPPSNPLRIKSNKNPGVQFTWGRHKIIYTAFDRANNNGSCEFFVEIGPVKCPLFDPPQHGIRACNKKTQNSNGITYEMLCNVQCKKGYAFSESTPEVFMCQSDGIWNQMLNGFPMPIANKEKKPWPDCAPEEGASAMMKEFTFYTGACVGNEDDAMNHIRQNFINAIKKSPMANFVLCEVSQNQDCVVNNVKVYCGSRSKRGGSSVVERIITFEFVIKDTKPDADSQLEADKLNKMLKELDVLEGYLKSQFSSQANMPSLQVEAKKGSAFCEAPRVKRVMDGLGPEIQRSLCVQCPIGTHYDNTTKSCGQCAVGDYQDEVGQTFCKHCPAGKLSVEGGASNSTDCYDLCKPGEYTHRGVVGSVTCLACPLGSYQPMPVSKSCLQCPQGKTTRSVGTSSLAECQ